MKSVMAHLSLYRLLQSLRPRTSNNIIVLWFPSQLRSPAFCGNIMIPGNNSRMLVCHVPCSGTKTPGILFHFVASHSCSHYQYTMVRSLLFSLPAIFTTWSLNTSQINKFYKENECTLKSPTIKLTKLKVKLKRTWN